MFRKTNLVAALATAVLGAAALASPASAQPIDSFTLDTPNHRFSFGNGCAPGQPPVTNGTLDWNLSAGGGAVSPQLIGTLCLQGTTADARLHVLYHDAGGAPITQYRTNTATGNGSPLNTFAVNRTGPQISLQSVDHVHVDLERDNGGGWGVVDTITLFP
jgi:hypothetical protein